MDPRERIPHFGELVYLIKRVGGAERDDPVKLSTGEETSIYLDVKNVLSTGHRMRLAAQVMTGWLHELRTRHNAIGGPTMGADVISHAVALQPSLTSPEWFSVRDHPKITHGLGKWIEGAELGPQHRVVLTDDVANSGHSLREAYEIVARTGAQVMAVVPLVDRAAKAHTYFDQIGIPYEPLITHQHLQIHPLEEIPA